MSYEITFRAVASIYEGDASVDCDKPAGTVDNDIMLALVVVWATDGAPTITAPSGWTAIGTNTQSIFRWSIYRKKASSEGASYTWSHNGSGADKRTAVAIVSYYDADIVTPVDEYSNTAYTTNDVNLRGAAVTPEVQPGKFVLLGSCFIDTTFTPPGGYTERLDTLLGSHRFCIADKTYTSTDSSGAVDATAANARDTKHAFLVALSQEWHYPEAPVISEPDAGDAFVHRTRAEFVCAADDPGADPVFYTWQIDTADTFDTDELITLVSGYTASGADNSVYYDFDRADRGTWYCRAKASDGTYESAYSADTEFTLAESVRLLPDTSIEVSTLECANKVYATVDGDPVEDATNTTIDPTYANSPREMVVLVKAGDSTALQAVADAHLALRQSPRYRLSGLKVPLRYGLGIQRGQKVQVTIPRAALASGTYAVRRVEHDFGANISTIDVGEYSTPRDQEEALVRLAEITAKLEKEAAI